MHSFQYLFLSVRKKTIPFWLHHWYIISYHESLHYMDVNVMSDFSFIRFQIFITEYVFLEKWMQEKNI